VNCQHRRRKNRCPVCTPRGAWLFYRHNAKADGRPFRISLAVFKRLISEACWYCGTEDEPRGLDRVDNRKGYTSSNVRPCCEECNRMKGTLAARAFVDLCQKVGAATEQEELMDLYAT
jgi:hypothetical protein